MARISIIESSGWARDGQDRFGGNALQGPYTHQAVEYGAATQSAAFQSDTRLVRVCSDTDAMLAFGSNPSVDNTGIYLPADQVEIFHVEPAWKLSVSTKDEAAPSISTLVPADDATGVAVTIADLVATFSESIKFGASGTITLRENDGGFGDLETFDVTSDVGSGAGQVEISGADLTIHPSANLVGGREYAVRIGAGAIEDLSDNDFAGISDDTTWSFTAEAVAPTLSSTVPVDDATDVDVDTPITATFSEDIQFGTGNIVLRKNDGGFADEELFDVATDVGSGAGQVEISGDTLTIHPTGNLDNSMEYAIRIAATAIDDLGGTSYAGIADDTTWSFTTVAA